MVRFTSTWAVALLLAANTVFAAAGDTADRKDFQVFKDVASSVERYAQFTIFDDISAEVKDGVVTLTGRVTMPFKRDEIAKRIGNVVGVRQVQDNIDVLPVSQWDDELRYQIAASIYNNSNFWNYTAMANPPIHVIVEHGRVTLTGVVQSNVDRMLAQSLATGFGAFSVKNELKTDAEVRNAFDKP